MSIQRDWVSLPWMTDEESDALVRGYPEERLRENYERASEHPDNEWYRLLSAEMARRGLL